MLCEDIEDIEVVKAFNDPLKLIKEADHLDFDLCILDIEMPGLNGLEVAKSLKGKHIIFTTAYKEFAAEAFDLEAIDYIRKPIQKERLEKAIDKAFLKINSTVSEKKYIQLNTNKGKALLYFNQLIYITSSEIDKRDKLAYLKNGEQYVLKNITYEQLIQQLPKTKFCRINKKDIIHINAINLYSHNEIQTNIVQKGQKLKLTLSDTYRKEFLQKTAH